MRGHIKATIAGVVAVAVIGTSAAVWAVDGPNGQSAAPAPSTTTSTTAKPVVQDVESVTPTTAAPTPSGPSAEVIKAAQQRLSDLGYWVGDIDGQSGQATQQALLAFQKIQSLPKTGTLDAATTAALATASRPAPASVSGDLIEVDKKRQVIFIVRNGQTLWALNTSTGTEQDYVTNGVKGHAHTPTGTFKVLRAVNAVDPGPLGPLYRPRYFTNTGIAIHGAAAIPATPASHGCARISNAAEDYIWAQNLMPIGSTVWVYDDPATQPFAVPPATTSTTAAPPTTSTTAPPATTTTTIAPTTTVPPTTVLTVPPTTPTTN